MEMSSSYQFCAKLIWTRLAIAKYLVCKCEQNNKASFPKYPKYSFNNIYGMLHTP